MEDKPRNHLEEALLLAEDPAYREAFYKLFSEWEIFLIQEDAPSGKTGRRVLEEDYTLKARFLEIDGKDYIPIFSELSRLEDVITDDRAYIGINAMTLLNIIGQSELYLNPGSDIGKIFTREEIQSIVDGTAGTPVTKEKFKEGQEILIGQPNEYPTELINALTSYFKANKQVKKAYLGHYSIDGQAPHTIIGMEVSSEWDNMLEGAIRIAQNSYIPSPPVDFMQLCGTNNVVENYFREEVTPFYSKKLFGIL